MVKVIGNKNCSRCDMVKQILHNNNVEFEYVLFEDLENQIEIRNTAMESGKMNFPLIFKDGAISEIQEVIN